MEDVRHKHDMETVFLKLGVNIFVSNIVYLMFLHQCDSCLTHVRDFGVILHFQAKSMTNNLNFINKLVLVLINFKWSELTPNFIRNPNVKVLFTLTRTLSLNLKRHNFSLKNKTKNIKIVINYNSFVFFCLLARSTDDL